MGQIEKTVFICYRRTNLPWALAIYQNLTTHGYDAFFDYQSINSGDFEQVILGNIRARAHFVVILTPSMLEKINKPNDWVRREIETALDEKRNIVPLFFEGFNFGIPSISNQLTGRLIGLKKYGGLDIPASYFLEAMERLRSRYMSVALDAVIHPVSEDIQKVVQKQKVAANKEKPVKEKELTAQEWFERGVKTTDLDERIYCYSEAIRLKPEYAEAYNNRGITRRKKGEWVEAIKDYNEAIRLKSDYGNAYYNRGIARKNKGDLAGAIKDYNESIRLKPDYDAYYNRAIAREDKGDLDGAIKDYNEAIRLKPNYVNAHNNRGNVLKDIGDLDGAIKDYNEAIRLKPDYALAYKNRGIIWNKKGNYSAALEDFEKSIELGNNEPSVAKRIQKLRKLIK